ncbi:S49 family peptidase [Roseicyclus sp.]|uniref:S49 family peptidase n=1 Tax=Roseicyclus sp. TaxID=1914329 RepID=UPI003FA0F69C
MRRFIPFMTSDPVVAVVRLQGAIMANPRGAGLSDQGIASAIERAFRRGKPKAVALAINSPGGSPVQSSLIAARIRRLAEEKKLPVHAFVEDVAASGGYWLACAADHIWADHSSIVGSIGVISAGFGFTEAIHKLGVERRVYTSGESKSILDPFRPEKEADVARLKSLQSDIHEAFIAHVKARRGARLSDDPELFTGAFWTGARSVELGLADGVAHLVPKMKALYGDKTRFAVYGPKRSLFGRVGLSLASEIATGLEERAAYARFGLQ